MNKMVASPHPHSEDACIFCHIVKGDSPADIVFRDEKITAFWDANPAAPVHILLVPNRHIRSINEIKPEDEELIGHLFTVAAHIARTQGIEESGYRVVANTGKNAGQSVMHLHLHILGGRHLGYHLKW